MSFSTSWRNTALAGAGLVAAGALMFACKTTSPGVSVVTGDAASRVYVAPGKHDELYAFMSGGFSGQIAVYGLPSGRLIKVVPVFSQNP